MVVDPCCCPLVQGSVVRIASLQARSSTCVRMGILSHIQQGQGPAAACLGGGFTLFRVPKYPKRRLAHPLPRPYYFSLQLFPISTNFPVFLPLFLSIFRSSPLRQNLAIPTISALPTLPKNHHFQFPIHPFSPQNPAHACIFPTRMLSIYFFLIFCPNRPSIEHFSLLSRHFFHIFLDFFLIIPSLFPSTRHSCHSLPHPILPKTFSPQISQSVIFSTLSRTSF